MKKELSKILSIIIILTILMTSIIPVFAEDHVIEDENEYNEVLEETETEIEVETEVEETETETETETEREVDIDLEKLEEEIKGRIESLRDKKTYTVLNQLIEMQDEINESKLSEDIKLELILSIRVVVSEMHNFLIKEKIITYSKLTPSRELLLKFLEIREEINESEINTEQKKSLLIDLGKEELIVLEKVFLLEINKYSKESSSQLLLEKLKELKIEINKTNLLLTTKHVILNELELVIARVSKDLEGIITKLDESTIKRGIKYYFEDSNVYMSFPKLMEGYTYNYSIINISNNKVIASGKTKGGAVNIPQFPKNKFEISIAISIVEDKAEVEVLSFITNEIIEDKEKPAINYAYVENGVLKLSISDNYRLNEYPISYKVANDRNYTDIHIRDVEYEYQGRERVATLYSINIDIPSRLNIIVRDYFDIENSYTINITSDNSPVTKDVPEIILKKLEETNYSKVKTFNGYDNIFQLEYGKKVNPKKVLDSLIKSNYGRYNTNDISIEVKGYSFDKDGNITLNKSGLSKVIIKNSKEKDSDKYAYFLVISENKSNIDGVVNKNPYVIYSNKFKVSDYISFTAKDIKEKVDTSLITVINKKTKEVININDDINIDLDELLELEILNFETSKKIDFKIIRKDKLASNSKNFIDISKDFWANSYITNILSKGFIAGYPDGTFRPSENITVKEFASMLSRYISLNPNKSREVNQDYKLNLNNDSWGFWEIKSILDRMDKAEISKFSLSNFDRYITRDEVVYLISKTIILENDSYNNQASTLQDIYKSNNPQDVIALINNGLISGYPDKTFRPANNITRAEIATIFSRLK